MKTFCKSKDKDMKTSCKTKKTGKRISKSKNQNMKIFVKKTDFFVKLKTKKILKYFCKIEMDE